ncbi:unnamed protein product [Blepharisma stoltei]|uniref:Roadblock/LAMTOR2 domain-containing protein n=1 Tax=Blepharisma stoltei TaxID=1481888 RepID=A0AAU9JM49_9CILI|nr:unnamed protein product [Blepharisma stoltei]
MAASLNSYFENCGRSLEVTSLSLCDNNGVEIINWGEKIQEIQLLSAMFQSTLENSVKLPIGRAKHITLFYSQKVLIQKSMDSMFLAIVMPRDGPIGKVLTQLDKIERDLSPLAQIIASRES